MNHLLDLNEEFDLANSATPALEVVTWPDGRALGKVIPDSGRYLPNFVDHAEIQ